MVIGSLPSVILEICSVRLSRQGECRIYQGGGDELLEEDI